jgi:tRNA A37 threonylcarbamoyladenosine synthetase subunit TsaC/SUA5/YrdC
MIRTLQVPLVSTSANLSGQEVLDVPGALRVFKNNPRPDAALTAGKNKSRESRLLRLLDDGGLQTLRK